MEPTTGTSIHLPKAGDDGSDVHFGCVPRTDDAATPINPWAVRPIVLSFEGKGFGTFCWLLFWEREGDVQSGASVALNQLASDVL